MSTVSANATGLPDRRRILATLAGAGAFGLPAFATLPVLAAEPGPIEAMYPEHLRLEAELDAIGTRLADAEELYEPPARPRWHPVHDEGGYTTIMTTPGRGFCALDSGAENIAYLKDKIAREYEPDPDGWSTSNKLRARRARKTLAKIEAWEAKVRRRRDVTGVTEAEEAYEIAGDAATACRDAIFAIEASTFRELAFQAAILDESWDQAAAERVLTRLVELAGVVPHQAA